jgi:hypothetical protein
LIQLINDAIMEELKQSGESCDMGITRYYFAIIFVASSQNREVNVAGTVFSAS